MIVETRSKYGSDSSKMFTAYQYEKEIMISFYQPHL